MSNISRWKNAEVEDSQPGILTSQWAPEGNGCEMRARVRQMMLEMQSRYLADQQHLVEAEQVEGQRQKEKKHG